MKYTVFIKASFLCILALGVRCSTINNVNLFSPEQDAELGKQVAQEIESDPKNYPLLPEAGNQEVYAYVRKITQKLIATGKVDYAKQFAWQVKIINDPKTLNAFCTPGGYIYVYTGLIKYLDSEDQLAGVLGHEIAHAAKRHSTKQMTKVYGLQMLLAVVTNKADPGMIEQIALGLSSLKFSRDNESEADQYSVKYLCPTDYNAAGAAGFFKKIKSQGGNPPEFLSTHPSPDNRIENIESNAKSLNCGGSATYTNEYSHIKSLIK